MNDSIAVHSKGITKILLFWDEQLQFKKVKKKEEHAAIDLVLKMVMNKSLYSTNAFVLFPKKMIPFEEEIFANGIILVMKKFLYLLNEGKIKKEKFAKNNDIVTFFIGNKTKKISSYFLRTKKYKVDEFDLLLVKKKVRRKECEIKGKVIKPLYIPKDVKKMLVMWNKRSCFKKTIIDQADPSKTLKSVVFLLKKYLKGGLYTTNKSAVFPNGVDPFEMSNCGSLTQWKLFLDRFEKALVDETFLPKNKTAINKYANISNFLIGGKYSKYPSPSMLLSYCLKEPIKNIENIEHSDSLIKELVEIYEEMVPTYEFKKEDNAVFSKCLTIMEEIIKDIGTSDERSPVVIGIAKFESAIKSSGKNPKEIKNVNYIRSGYFTTLFRKFYTKIGDINSGY